MKKCLLLITLPLAGCFTANESTTPVLEEERPLAVCYRVETSSPEARRKKAIAYVEKLRKNPKLLDDFPFVYPPAEERAKYEHRAGAFSAEWLAISLLPGSRITFEEETLLRFLERANWDEADDLVCCLWLKDELGPESRRKLAPRVEAFFGRKDNFVMRLFYCHPNTPDDVIERALQHPQANDVLKRQIREYRDERKAGKAR